MSFSLEFAILQKKTYKKIQIHLFLNCQMFRFCDGVGGLHFRQSMFIYLSSFYVLLHDIAISILRK